MTQKHTEVAHLIARADAVQVLNLAGHIDARTLHELCFAHHAQKPITWLEDWPMYCPTCRTTGPESEHFFHNVLTLHDLNDLLATSTAEHLPYLDGQLADWYDQIVPVILLPNGLPALQVDLICPVCEKRVQTAYAVPGEYGAWVTLVDPAGLPLTDLCVADADERVQRLVCANGVPALERGQGKATTWECQCLPAEDVLAHGTFQKAIKTATTRIKELTEQDVALLGSTFRDLEGRLQCVEVGRYLCIGAQGEQWTCSAKSMQDRVAMSGPDADGFCQYHQRDPQPVLVTILTEPFTLNVRGEVWRSQPDGGVITWNGKTGDELQMRVIARDIFATTYQMVDCTQGDVQEREVRDGE